MRVIVLSVMLLGALSASAAPAPQPKRAKSDLDRLQGEWKSAADENGEVVRLAVAGKQIRVRIESKFVSLELDAEIALDPKADPKRIDVREVHLRTQEIRHSWNERGCRGIYRLTGDTLTICLTYGPNGWPADFTIEAGHLVTFTRSKK